MKRLCQQSWSHSVHLLVEHVESHAIADPLDLGDQVAELLDGLHLLLEVLSCAWVEQQIRIQSSQENFTDSVIFTLDEVCHLWVVVIIGGLVELEEAVVHFLLQLQSILDGLQDRLPLSLGWLAYILRVNHDFSFNPDISISTNWSPKIRKSVQGRAKTHWPGSKNYEHF